MSNGDFICVRVVGALLPPDLLARILSGDKDLGGLTSSEYHLVAGESPKEAANRAWGYLLGAWGAYRQALAKLPEGDPAVGLTREKWLGTLFRQLDFGRLQLTAAGGLHADDKVFPVSHLWGSTPLHLLGWGVELDKRTRGVSGAAERAPQAMVQELLNRNDDYLWAMLSNGRTLRLLRDSTSMAGQAYVEFDLESMFDGEVFSDFALMYVMLHQSRVEVPEGGTPADCWLEKWRTSAAESGTRALGLLRDGVKDAIEALGTGFFQHPGNDLSQRIADGELRLEDYHRALLRLVYRLLFLFVAEDRGLLLSPEADPLAARRYRDYFSTHRLRLLARKRRGARHTDLWQGLQFVINALGDERGLPELGLPGLGGIFNHEPIDVVVGQQLPNEALLTAIRRLSVVQPKNSPPRVVDYRNLGAEELGSIYESLLELVPRHDQLGRTFTLENLAGNERKTSGSYYTPTSLIDLVLDEALNPLLDEAEREKDPDKALLAITVCDPACGSGHFLVAAARRIASRLATARTGELDPTPTDVQEALHKVVATCIHGVDLNPMAAELAKVSLWLEAMQPGRPMSFLDAHIKVGNALLGTTPRLLEQGLPDEAFVALTGDDKKWTSALKKRNKSEREQESQLEMFAAAGLSADNRALAVKAQAIDTGAVESLADAHHQAQRYKALHDDPVYANARLVADAWCAAFVQSKTPDASAITHATLQQLQDNLAAVDSGVRKVIEDAAVGYRFFHWHLEFPQVFQVHGDLDADSAAGWVGGFTCVLGNPPWERVKLQEQEFFASRNEAIAKAPNAAARKRLIKQLKLVDPALGRDFDVALRRTECESQFLRVSGRFPLTGRGDVNTYSVFAETMLGTAGPAGHAGMIVPTGLATDATTSKFISSVLLEKRLVTFYDFENEEKIFSGVHNQFRFAAVVLSGRNRHPEQVRFAFYTRFISDVHMRRFKMDPSEVLLLNPNTGTLPVFRTRKDAQITLNLYRRFPILVRDDPHSNTWGLRFFRMFDMANDSGDFRLPAELEQVGGNFDGWAWESGPNRWLPLYEAKMLSHWDHRFATYAGATQEQINKGTLPRTSRAQKGDPSFESVARYWVDRSTVTSAIGGRASGKWLLGWRKITRGNNERTMTPFVFPSAGAGDSCLLAFTAKPLDTPTLHSIWASFAFDYVVRQKLSGSNLQLFVVEQLACPPPSLFEASASWGDGRPLKNALADGARELTYTSWRMNSYARDMGDEGPPFQWQPDRRESIKCELDAMMFHVFGLERDDVEHVMNSFVVVRKYDERDHGEFRTKRLILEYYDLLAEAIATGVPYQTPIDPPPGFGQRHDDSTRPDWMKEAQ